MNRIFIIEISTLIESILKASAYENCVRQREARSERVSGFLLPKDSGYARKIYIENEHEKRRASGCLCHMDMKRSRWQTRMF
jgi:hypothetical protein